MRLRNSLIDFINASMFDIQTRRPYIQHIQEVAIYFGYFKVIRLVKFSRILTQYNHMTFFALHTFTELNITIIQVDTY